MVNYSDECFVVLQRAKTKQHLIVLEAIHILFNRPSLSKQNSNTNNLHPVIWYQVFLSNTNNLHTVIWYQVFHSNTNNF